MKLCVATPRDIRAAGRGWQIGWGVAVSPFGPCTIGWCERGLLHLAFLVEEVHDDVPDDLLAAWPEAEILRDDPLAATWCGKIFAKDESARRRLSVIVRGTAFQVRIWRELTRIPVGRVLTYAELAGKAGHPRAARAAGAACGANRIAWLIPCHRVVAASGRPGGYRWGPGLKQKLLAAEARDGLNLPA